MNIATSCGFSEQYPYSDLERIIYIFLTYTGDGLFALAFGMIMSNSEMFSEHFINVFQKQKQVQLILKNTPLSNQMLSRVDSYFQHLCNSENSDKSNIKSISNFITKKFYEDLIFLRAKTFLLNFPIFIEARSYLLLREIAFKLEFTVYMPGDYIIIKDDIGEEMFFILEGNVNVLSVSDDEIIATLKSGDYFGEIALYMNPTKRICSVVAETYCEMCLLQKKFINEILDSFPIIREIFLKESKRRMDEIQKKSFSSNKTTNQKSPLSQKKINLKSRISILSEQCNEKEPSSSLISEDSHVEKNLPENDGNSYLLNMNSLNRLNSFDSSNNNSPQIKSKFYNITKAQSSKLIKEFMPRHSKKNSFYEEKLKGFSDAILKDDEFGNFEIVNLNLLIFKLFYVLETEDIPVSQSQFVEENELMEENLKMKRQSRRMKRIDNERRYSRISLKKEIKLLRNKNFTIKWSSHISEI